MYYKILAFKGDDNSIKQTYTYNNADYIIMQNEYMYMYMYTRAQIIKE